MALWPASFTDARISVTQGLDLDLRPFLVASMSPSTVLTKSIAFVGPLVAGTSLSLSLSLQGRNQDSYLGGGAKLKTKKKKLKINTNIYFIFNKILHTK